MKKEEFSKHIIDYEMQIITMCDVFGEVALNDVSFDFIFSVCHMIGENIKSLDEKILIIDQNKCECIIDGHFKISFDEIFYLNSMI